MEGTLTLDILRNAQREIEKLFAVPASAMREAPHSTAAELAARFSALSQRIIFTTNALEVTPERNFPVSKHRSKRIHKKLCKRFGGEFKMRPTMWQTPAGIFAHPSFRERLRAAGFN